MQFQYYMYYIYSICVIIEIEKYASGSAHQNASTNRVRFSVQKSWCRAVYVVSDLFTAHASMCQCVDPKQYMWG